MPQSLANNYLHLIFSTKERHPFLSDVIRPDLHAYMATVMKNIKCPVLRMNSVKDHIHILFNLHRTITLAKAVEETKKSSSKWLKSQSTSLTKFSWQAGYGAFSVSKSNITSVCEYIDRQREHHQTKSFKQEYIEFLARHRVDFDENFLWD